MKNEPITIQITINAHISKVWEYWSNPDHIVNWAFASDDWEAPSAENDLRVGGKFKTVISAKDTLASSGQVKQSFDFTGTYTSVEEHKLIEYTMDDGRKVSITFEKIDDDTIKVTQTFDPEDTYATDYQKSGWQSILDNFKKYVESN